MKTGSVKFFILSFRAKDTKKKNTLLENRKLFGNNFQETPQKEKRANSWIRGRCCSRDCEKTFWCKLFRIQSAHNFEEKEACCGSKVTKKVVFLISWLILDLHFALESWKYYNKITTLEFSNTVTSCNFSTDERLVEQRKQFYFFAEKVKQTWR